MPGGAVHSAAGGKDSIYPEVSSPDVCIDSTDNKLRLLFNLLHDPVKCATSTEPVVVPTKSMILEEENPWCLLVLTYEQLLISIDSVSYLGISSRNSLRYSCIGTFSMWSIGYAT